MQAVEPAEDAVALAQRAWPRPCDLWLAEVVPHLFERVGRGGDAADHDRQRGHEVDQPRKERAALQEVVVALDQVRRRLKPVQRLNLPVALRGEPAPDAS